MHESPKAFRLNVEPLNTVAGQRVYVDGQAFREGDGLGRSPGCSAVGTQQAQHPAVVIPPENHQCLDSSSAGSEKISGREGGRWVSHFLVADDRMEKVKNRKALEKAVFPQLCFQTWCCVAGLSCGHSTGTCRVLEKYSICLLSKSAYYLLTEYIVNLQGGKLLLAEP